MKQLKGIYLVIDPSLEEDELLRKLKLALDGGIDVLQIWNNWRANTTVGEKLKLIDKIACLAHDYGIPVLINDDWQLLIDSKLDGVHFDSIPKDWATAMNSIPDTKIIGFTAGNDLELIRWANQNRVNYLSFCAMFPTSSAVSCEIVKPSTVFLARQITTLPLFLSGGINPENLRGLSVLDFQGVAIISGIMNSPHPNQKVKEYKAVLAEIKR